MMRYEWKNEERELYGVKNKPQTMVVPRHNYIMLEGTGNPNQEDFSQRVGVLYSLAYPLKMSFKAGCKNAAATALPGSYNDFSVYPLEGVWNTLNPDNLADKSSFQYTIMIRQPEWITIELFHHVYETVNKKKPHPFLADVAFAGMEDGLSVQMLHHGSFDSEPESFAMMDAYAAGYGLKRTGHRHREIYLNDARKTAPDKRKTILRYQVSE